VVVWQDYLTNAGTWLGVTAVQAGIILSLSVTLGVVVAILIATRGRKAEITVPVGTLFVTVLFTFLGWYPIWTGSVLALVLAIFVGKVISGGL